MVKTLSRWAAHGILRPAASVQTQPYHICVSECSLKYICTCALFVFICDNKEWPFLQFSQIITNLSALVHTVYMALGAYNINCHHKFCVCSFNRQAASMYLVISEFCRGKFNLLSLRSEAI